MMAKQQDGSGEIKKLIEGLYKIVQTTNAQSQEQVRINRELLKVMALLQEGFAKNEEDARQLIEDVRDGLEIQDEYAVKWAKARKAEQKDVDNLLKKFREIENIHEDEIDNAKDYLELLNDRFDIITEEFDITKKLMESNREITRIITANRKIHQSINGSLDNSEKILKNIVTKRVDLGNIFGDMGQSVDMVNVLMDKLSSDMSATIDNLSGSIIEIPLHFNPLTDELDKELDKVMANIKQEKDARIKGLAAYFDANKKQSQQIARNLSGQMMGMDISVDIDTGRLTKAGKEINAASKEYVDIMAKLDQFSMDNDIAAKVKLSFQEIGGLLEQSGRLTDEQKNKLNSLLQPLGLANQIIAEQASIQLSDLNTLEEAIQLEYKKTKVLQNNLDLLQATEKTVRKVGNAFDFVASSLPMGLGDYLGFSKVSEQLMLSHKKGLESMVTTLTEGGSRAKALQGYYAAMAPNLKSILTPFNLFIAGSVLLYKFASGITEKYKSIGEQMKVSLVQSKQLFDSQLDIFLTTENQFTTLKDIQDIQTEMIGSAGKVFSATKKENMELVNSLSEMSKVFGYSVTDGTKLHKTFKDLGANDELARNLQADLGFMSEMVGLSPQIIAQDLLDNAETVYTYFAGMPKQAAQAALNTRRLGMSLKQAGSIAQKMLDLEGFMTDMYELYAMTGRGIDFSEAFDLGLSGDIEGMTKSIMKNIGSVENFSKMDFLTRTKLAKTLGMSVEDLSKSVKMHEQMAQFAGKEKEMLEKNIGRMGDISDMNKEQISQRLKDLQSTDRLAVAWDKIKGVLIKSILPLVEAFATGIDAIMPLIDFVIGGFKIVGSILKPISWILKGMLLPFQMITKAIEYVNLGLEDSNSWISMVASGVKMLFLPFTMIGTVISKISESIFGVKTETENVVGSMDSLKPVLEGLGAIIGSWFMLKNAKNFFGFVTDKIGGILPSITGLFSKTPKVEPTKINPVVAEAPEVKMDINMTKLTDSINKLSQTISGIPATVESSVVQSTQTIDKEITATDKKIKKTKTAASGIFANLGANEGFKMARDVGLKMVTLMAMDSLKGFIGMGKQAEAGVTANQAKIESALDGAFAVGSTLFTTYMSTAIGKVFEKRLEKSIEKGMEPAGEKAKSIFGKVKETITGKVMSQPEDIVDKVTEPKVDTEKITKPKKEIEPIDKPIPAQKQRQIKQPLVTDTAFAYVKSVWKGIKDIVVDISATIAKIAGNLSKGIGDVINNVLGSIGKGLNKFGTNAIKGGAALVLLSGSVYIMAKAMQEFNSVGWDSVAKGIVTLGGLSLAGIALGKSTPQMLKGALGIALLGASLIPMTYAMEKFNSIEWTSLAKAGTAIVGLGVIGAVIGPLIPTMLLGSLAIAALGASIIPLAYSLKMLNDVEWSSIGKGAAAIVGLGTTAAILTPLVPAIGLVSGSIGVLGAALSVLAPSITSLDATPIFILKDALVGLSSVSVVDIFAISAALATLSVGIAALKITGGLTGLFETDKIVGVASSLNAISGALPSIQTTNSALIEMNNILVNIGKTVDNIDFSKVSDINFQKVEPKIEPTTQPVKLEETLKYFSIASQPKPQPPRKEAVAQNYNVEKLVETNNTMKTEREAIMQKELEQTNDGIYDLSTAKIEQLLTQLINVVSNQRQSQPTTVDLDGYTVNNIIKKYNNR